MGGNGGTPGGIFGDRSPVEPKLSLSVSRVWDAGLRSGAGVSLTISSGRSTSSLLTDGVSTMWLFHR